MFSQTTRRALIYPRLRPSSLLYSRRPLHSSIPSLLPRKDAQGKDDLTPESNEYSKSGSDAQSAQVEKAAFDPSKTSPEEQHDTAGQEAGSVSTTQSSGQSNPLNVSPANQEVSQPRGNTEGGPEGSSGETGQGSQERGRTSGRGSPTKKGGNLSG
ncbi:hypothetical protein EV356DRAFT_528154 [Viridothelium virens]|uniref:Uncharacterized protein n=1 Tax=Viridothelium virens TaxID=1048519 RepID=A0A6A6HNA4_VIRVR|nr:hypothetical protein EV356DRAFT_528154 [Viridothelium virens]